MNYIEYYKLTFGWTLAICYNLIYLIGILTVLKFIFKTYIIPFIRIMIIIRRRKK